MVSSKKQAQNKDIVGLDLDFSDFKSDVMIILFFNS